MLKQLFSILAGFNLLNHFLSLSIAPDNYEVDTTSAIYGNAGGNVIMSPKFEANAYKWTRDDQISLGVYFVSFLTRLENSCF